MAGRTCEATAQVHQQHQVFEYFGTAGRAMFTMFELTLAQLGTGNLQCTFETRRVATTKQVARSMSIQIASDICRPEDVLDMLDKYESIKLSINTSM